MQRLVPIRSVRAAVLGLLVGLTGCQSMPPRWTGTEGSMVEPAAHSTTAPGTFGALPQDPEKSVLPPAESARLCLSTAQGMDRAGEIPQAIALYTRARELDRSQKAVCRRLAVLYDLVGEFALAGREYEEALRLAPRDATLLNDFGYSCYCQGKFAEAEKHLRRAIELEPKQERAWVNLGLALAMQQHYREALTAFEKVVPEGQAHSNLGFVQASQGKRAEAMASYRSALQHNPNLPRVRDALVKLEQEPAHQPFPPGSSSNPTIQTASHQEWALPGQAIPHSGFVPVSGNR